MTANVTHDKGITDVSSRVVTELARHHLAVAVTRYDKKEDARLLPHSSSYRCIPFQMPVTNTNQHEGLFP